MIKWIFSLMARRRRISSAAHNVVVSIGKAKALYKELIIKAHPDRHQDKRELAEEITRHLNESRRNYSELLIIRQRIETEL